MLGRGKIRGLWSAECYSPITVENVPKVEEAFRANEIPIDIIRNNHIVYRDYLSYIEPNLSKLTHIKSELSCPNMSWKINWENIVVNQGLDHILDVALSSGVRQDGWYLGLVASGSPSLAAGDTMGSHAGWFENVNYSESNRQTWINAGIVGQSGTNYASPAIFTCNANSQVIGGAFLTSDNAKLGTSGILYAEGTFSSTKTLDTDDTLTIRATFSNADDGV